MSEDYRRWGRSDFLKFFRESAQRELSGTAANLPQDKKAQLVNNLMGRLLSKVKDDMQTLVADNAQGKKSLTESALTAQYTASVVYLEERHKVWAYEYMAFARRVGELWEDLCSTCWHFSNRTDISFFEAPSLKEIRQAQLARLTKLSSADQKSLIAETDLIWDLLGEVSLNEDMLFNLKDQPFVVDFKSGFSSNEKGNTQRLLVLAKLYKMWNPNTVCHLLVRQPESSNNHYLSTLKKSGYWKVECADDAYRSMGEYTGFDVLAWKKANVDFHRDLNPLMLAALKEMPGELQSYLSW